MKCLFHYKATTALGRLNVNSAKTASLIPELTSVVLIVDSKGDAGKSFAEFIRYN